MRILSFLIIWLLASVSAAEPIAELNPPYTLEKVRSWQKSIGQWPWHFPPEQEVTLSAKGKQLLVAIDGGTRSGRYILFAKAANGWVPISEPIEQAHHPVHILSHSVSGWHDFQSFTPLWGSGGKEVLVLTYRWNGHKYAAVQQQEGQFCDFEPFKQNKEWCNR